MASSFGRCVFVNVPFDLAYLPLLHAILFAIHDCGFIARIAVEEIGSNENRLAKIVRIIRESRFSIHDICRVEISVDSPLPRFNMPFECGLALGAIRYGDPEDNRDFLLMVAEPFQDKRTLSDLAGQDAIAHRNDPKLVISAIRAFLSGKADADVKIRGAKAIWERYIQFNLGLERLCERLELTVAEIESFDYLSDWIKCMTAWLQRSRSGKVASKRV